MKTGGAPAAFSLEEFVWIWNRLQGQGTPRLHHRIAAWLENAQGRGETRLLLMAFRASGKSTLVGLYCAWRLCLNPDARILILAADQALAVKMARNVRRVIERHPLAEGLIPDRPDQWAADRFTVRRRLELRDPSVMARGLGANLTGSRADLAVCDDVEVPNSCDTAAKRAELRLRLAEIDYILTPGSTQLYVGTPHSHASIYTAEGEGPAGETPFLTGFTRLVIPVVDADGISAWPERFGPAVVARLRQRQGPAKFGSQMLLQPVSPAAARLDPDRLRPYDATLRHEERNGRPALLLDGCELLSASCWWDPAFSAPGRGDRSVLACVFTDALGRYRLHALQYLEVDPEDGLDEARQQCLAAARFVEAYDLPSLTIETNGIGRFLPGLLRSMFRERGLAAAVVETHATRPKALRILEAFDAVLAAGSLLAHRSVWNTPFIAEMRDWRPGAAGADDGLDAVAGCLAAEPVRLRPGRARVPALRRDWRRGAASHQAAADFRV